MVSASPMASDRTLASASNGHELAVFGSVVAVCACAEGADEDVATPDRDAVVDGADDGALVAAGVLDAAARGAPAVGTIACTSFSVITRGGSDVTMVALS